MLELWRVVQPGPSVFWASLKVMKNVIESELLVFIDWILVRSSWWGVALLRAITYVPAIFLPLLTLILYTLDSWITLSERKKKTEETPIYGFLILPLLSLHCQLFTPTTGDNDPLQYPVSTVHSPWVSSLHCCIPQKYGSYIQVLVTS